MIQSRLITVNFRRRTLEMKQKKWKPILVVMIVCIVTAFFYVDQAEAFEIPQVKSLTKADGFIQPGELEFTYQLLNEERQPVNDETQLKVGENYLVSTRYHLKEFDNTQEVYNHNILFSFNEGLSYVADSFYIGSTHMPETHLNDEALAGIMPNFPNELDLPMQGTLASDMEIFYLFKVTVDSVTGMVNLLGNVTGETADGAGGIKQFTPIALSLAKEGYFVAPDFQMLLAVNQAQAQVGDILDYTLTAQNKGGKVGASMLKNTLPSGVEYLPNTTKINGLPVDDSAWNGNVFYYDLPSIAENETTTFTYQVKVTEAQDSISQQVSLEGVTSQDQSPFTIASNSVMTTVTNTPIQSSVTVHFKDGAGESLKPSLTLNGITGTSYEVDKEIAGYRLKTVIGDSEEIFAAEPKEVTYIYEKSQSVSEEQKINNPTQKQPENQKANQQLPKTGETIQNQLFTLIGIISLLLFLGVRRKIN